MFDFWVGKISWRREWQPTPVLWSGEFHGPFLVGYSTWHHKESDMTEQPTLRASQVVLVVKNSPADAGDMRGTGLIPGLGRSPGGRLGNSFQYSYLEKPMDRGAWLATVHRVSKSWTQVKRLGTTHTLQFTLAGTSRVVQ